MISNHDLSPVECEGLSRDHAVYSQDDAGWMCEEEEMAGQLPHFMLAAEEEDAATRMQEEADEMMMSPAPALSRRRSNRLSSGSGLRVW